MKMPFEALLLPLDDEYINKLGFFDALLGATRALGKYEEKTRQQPDGAFPPYVMNHLLKLESIYSTKIEGTNTSIEAVYAADLDNEKEKAKRSGDIYEVLKYNEALECGINADKTSPISDRTIKEIHNILLSGDARTDTMLQAGEYREQQNRVGEHLPPVATEVPKLMGNLVRYINSDLGGEDALDSIVKAAIIHAQFETIHPFPDGNGRVGRVLIPLYLYKEERIQLPYFFISHELERNKARYYGFLQGTRKKTAKGFTDWIIFFCNAIMNQVERDLTFLDELEEIRKRLIEQIRKTTNSNMYSEITEAIMLQPLFNFELISNRTGLHINTVRAHINKLAEKNIVFPADSRRRNKLFVMPDIIDLLNK